MTSRDVTVVGVGRIGVVTAVGMAHLLHRVTGVDTSANRIAELQQGALSESEPGLRAALQSALRLRDIRFATHVVPNSADFAFVCVDTPGTPAGGADLRQLFTAAAETAPAVRTDGFLIVRSTIPPGTSDALQEIIAATGRPDIRVAHVPEFLREGSSWEDFRQPDRIVVGADEPTDRERVTDLFGELGARSILTTRRTAELAKYAANTFLATSVSFANEIADLGDAFGADTPAIFEILRTDSRIGRLAYLTPGLGFGGHCLPKDTVALLSVAESRGLPMPQLRATIATNDGRSDRVTSWLMDRLGDLHRKRIALSGLAFKPGSDDLRASPAIRLASLLTVMGATVTAFDEAVVTPVDGVHVRQSLVGAAEGADAIVVVHPTRLLEVGPERLVGVLRRRLLYDAPGQLQIEPWIEAGFETNRVATASASVDFAVK